MNMSNIFDSLNNLTDSLIQLNELNESNIKESDIKYLITLISNVDHVANMMIEDAERKSLYGKDSIFSSSSEFSNK